MHRVRQILEQQYIDISQSIESEKNSLLIKLEDYIKSITSKYVWNRLIFNKHTIEQYYNKDK